MGGMQMVGRPLGRRGIRGGEREGDAGLGPGLRSSWNHLGSKREFLGHECTAAFAVESRDLDDVQQLLVDLVDAGANEIEGVDFAVIAKADMGAEARRKAVGAARDRQRCTPRQPGRGWAGGAHRRGRVS